MHADKSIRWPWLLILLVFSCSWYSSVTLSFFFFFINSVRPSYSGSLDIWASSWENLFRGLRPGKTQTGLLSHRSYLEAWNFGYRNYRSYTIQAANNKGADQTVRTRRLICTIVVRIWQKQVFSWRGSYVSSELSRAATLVVHTVCVVM